MQASSAIPPVKSVEQSWWSWTWWTCPSAHGCECTASSPYTGSSLWPGEEVSCTPPWTVPGSHGESCGMYSPNAKQPNRQSFWASSERLRWKMLQHTHTFMPTTFCSIHICNTNISPLQFSWLVLSTNTHTIWTHRHCYLSSYRQPCLNTFHRSFNSFSIHINSI